MSILGTDKLDKAVDRIAKFKDELLAETLRRIQLRTPVDTGLLQASFYSWVAEDTIGVSNPVDYHDYVEGGTDKMQGTHMVLTTGSEMKEIAELAAKKAKL